MADFFDDNMKGGTPVGGDYGGDIPGPKMIRQKEDLTNQMADAVREIELLRKKQEDLEKERNSLEELTSRQEEYEHGKREVIENIARSMAVVEREELQATRLAELLNETRDLFSSMLVELRKINEESWSDEDFDVELSRAMALVESARVDYRKALARIEAANWRGAGSGKKRGSIEGEVARELGGEKGFGYWFKVGLAVSLPLIVVIVLVFVVWPALQIFLPTWP